MDPTCTMEIRCTNEKGWHVRIEWSDGYIDHFEPRNVPENPRSTLGNILDLRDCQAFCAKNGS